MVVSAGRAGGLVGCGVLAGNAVCKLVLAMLAFVASKLWSWCDAQLASESECGLR